MRNRRRMRRRRRRRSLRAALRAIFHSAFVLNAASVLHGSIGCACNGQLLLSESDPLFERATVLSFFLFFLCQMTRVAAQGKV